MATCLPLAYRAPNAPPDLPQLIHSALLLLDPSISSSDTLLSFYSEPQTKSKGLPNLVTVQPPPAPEQWANRVCSEDFLPATQTEADPDSTSHFPPTQQLRPSKLGQALSRPRSSLFGSNGVLQPLDLNPSSPLSSASLDSGVTENEDEDEDEGIEQQPFRKRGRGTVDSSSPNDRSTHRTVERSPEDTEHR
jgi:hypothetical protein